MIYHYHDSAILSSLSDVRWGQEDHTWLILILGRVEFDEMQTLGGDLSLSDMWWLEEDRKKHTITILFIVYTCQMMAMV